MGEAVEDVEDVEDVETGRAGGSKMSDDTALDV